MEVAAEAEAAVVVLEEAVAAAAALAVEAEDGDSSSRTAGPEVVAVTVAGEMAAAAMVANRVVAATVVSKAAGAAAANSKAAGVEVSSSPPVAAADGEETIPEAKEGGDKTEGDLVVTQTATPVVEVVLGVAAAAAPCDLAVLVEETVRCLTGTTEGAAGVEGAVTAGTELLPPVSTSTRLTV